MKAINTGSSNEESGEVQDGRRTLLTGHGRSQPEKGTRKGRPVDQDRIGTRDRAIREGDWSAEWIKKNRNGFEIVFEATP